MLWRSSDVSVMNYTLYSSISPPLHSPSSSVVPLTQWAQVPFMLHLSQFSKRHSVKTQHQREIKYFIKIKWHVKNCAILTRMCFIWSKQNQRFYHQSSNKLSLTEQCFAPNSRLGCTYTYDDGMINGKPCVKVSNPMVKKKVLSHIVC